MTKNQYRRKYKNPIAEILYGPVGDVFDRPKLAQKMRDSITKLCGEIDEVSNILEAEGAFDDKDA